MATMQGITGKLSGKMGSAVFRVRDGQQVVAQYNPIVKNPNSAGQKAQRAKFKLMSQLSAVLDAGIGTMGVTKRASSGAGTRRNGFVQKNFALATVDDTTADEVVAKVPMEQLQLTDSTRFLGNIAASASAADNFMNVKVSDVPEAVDKVRFVVVAYPLTNNQPQPVVRTIIDVDVNHTTGEVDTDINVGDFASGDKYSVLAYGMIPLTTMGKTSLDNLHTPADEPFTGALNLSSLVANGDVAETMTLGANVTATA